MSDPVYVHRLYDACEVDFRPKTGQIYRTTRSTNVEAEPYPYGISQGPLFGQTLTLKNAYGISLGKIDIDVTGRGEVSYPEFLAEDVDSNADLYEVGRDLVGAAYQTLWDSGYAYAYSQKSFKEFLETDSVEVVVTFDSSLSVEERDDDTLDNADLIIDLHEFELTGPVLKNEQENGTIQVRRTHVSERRLVTEWIADKFGWGWASEIDTGYNRTPPTVVVAAYSRDTFEDPASHLVGFVSFDTTRKGFATAIAVADEHRGSP